MEFSEKIRFLRKKNKLSQAELGKQVGVSNRAVSKWENGESMPATDTLLSIATVFGVTLDFFLKHGEQEEKRREIEPGMESLKELYKIGIGPSSSHTMGPAKAALLFRQKYPEATRYKAVLQGSLAKTGKGHRTDFCILEVFSPKECEIEFDIKTMELYHPNTLLLYAYEKSRRIGFWEVYSVGGGSIVIKGQPVYKPQRIYPHNSFAQIAEFCQERNIRLWEYVERFEGKEIWDYLKTMWEAMLRSMDEGLRTEGELFGGLGVQRRAKHLFRQRHIDENAETRENRLVCAYAFAVSEQNAACGTIVTAPTCGSCGILPAVLRYVRDKRGLEETEILHALATAGLMGNLIKTNASISGAECGCQAEVGSACAMASAGLGELYGMALPQIEYAAEVALEHHLGLTCDPIGGLVQIPCIERNAVAAMRAINAVNLANFLTDSRKISFDTVVKTMYETGKDLSHRYRETSEGGLAKLYVK
ncbi:MAG: L-serine ammonia-lyase, iron-sulfur-dependent, subunit alpha [Clostridia bacterium]|nr:L-serine ammonia-lyase, iron-sulfur-dependent, subunit alpha [Clostridia bacterium]